MGHIYDPIDDTSLCAYCGLRESDHPMASNCTGGKKFDEGKPKLGLVPKSIIWAIGWILTFGAMKYGEHNWRKGIRWSRVYNALLRHLTAWWAGENSDPETGRSHLWHAAAELAFLIEYEESKTGEDDRYKK